mmetsp:Transcript_25669/g.77373  ORF Transcript_25669/g.77373 Transcript_25669/m.77373 type:complete len:208 (+) Transcript_25669:204-827(+)
MAPMLRFKVVLLGEGRVGKTSILLRYTKDEYSEKQVSTLQASYLDKRTDVGGRRCTLSVWDTAGQERFHALGPIYYRDADGAILVYDITDHESFQKVRKWVRELRQIVGPDISLTIAGNKVDLEDKRAVSEAEALAYAESAGATHVYTSAKRNTGLGEAFDDLAARMARRRSEAPGGGLPTGKTGRASLTIIDDPAPEAPKKKSNCC